MPALTNFSSNLPLVIIDALGQAIPDGSDVDAYAVFIETNAPTGRATLSSPADYAGRLGIGLHGSSSLSFPKQPYKIELRDETDNPVNCANPRLPRGERLGLVPPVQRQDVDERLPHL